MSKKGAKSASQGLICLFTRAFQGKRPSWNSGFVFTNRSQVLITQAQPFESDACAMSWLMSTQDGEMADKENEFKFNCRERIRQCIWKVKDRASQYLKLFSCNKLMCSCKNEAHVANYCNYKLSRDTEKNPGLPTYVDPNKTIAQDGCPLWIWIASFILSWNLDHASTGFQLKIKEARTVSQT